MENQITETQLLNWLGSDNTLKEALDCLLDIANGKYNPQLLQKEINDYNQE